MSDAWEGTWRIFGIDGKCDWSAVIYNGNGPPNDFVLEPVKLGESTVAYIARCSVGMPLPWHDLVFQPHGSNVPSMNTKGRAPIQIPANGDPLIGGCSEILKDLGSSQDNDQETLRAVIELPEDSTSAPSPRVLRLRRMPRAFSNGTALLRVDIDSAADDGSGSGDGSGVGQKK